MKNKLTWVLCLITIIFFFIPALISAEWEIWRGKRKAHKERRWRAKVEKGYLAARKKLNAELFMMVERDPLNPLKFLIERQQHHPQVTSFKDALKN